MSTEERFNKTIEVLKKHIDVESLPNDDKLKFYQCFKQGTVGDCNVPKPGFLDLKGKAKYNAWMELKGVSKDEAQLKYIE